MLRGRTRNALGRRAEQRGGKRIGGIRENASSPFPADFCNDVLEAKRLARRGRRDRSGNEGENEIVLRCWKVSEPGKKRPVRVRVLEILTKREGDVESYIRGGGMRKCLHPDSPKKMMLSAVKQSVAR